MSGKTVEWLVVLIFFVSFFAVTAAESAWLRRKANAPAGKAFAFSFATNIFSITVGFSLSFVVFGALIYLAGASGEAAPSNAAAGFVAALAPVGVSVLVKRLGLRVTKLDAAVMPWIFSLAASLIFLFVVTAVPALFIYFV